MRTRKRSSKSSVNRWNGKSCRARRHHESPIFRHGVDPSNEGQRTEQHAWMLAKMDRFREVFAGRVKALTFVPASDAGDTEDAPDE